MNVEQLNEFETKAQLAKSGANHDGFGWLSAPVVQAARSRCFGDCDETSAQTMLDDLTEDEAFKNACIRVRGEVQAGRMAEWMPFARMLLMPRMPTGALMHLRQVHSNHLLHVISLPSKQPEEPPQTEVQYFPLLQNRQLGGPRQSKVQLVYREAMRVVEGVETLVPLQVLVPPSPTHGLFVNEELTRFDSDVFPSLRLLQGLAKDKRWKAFGLLTENCVGVAKELAELIAKTVVWSVEAERLRVALFPSWQGNVRGTYPLSPLRCAKNVFGMQTLKGFYQSCEGCPLDTDCVMTKNPELRELRIAAKLTHFLPFGNCTQCGRMLPQHKTFIFPSPVVLVWKKRTDQMSLDDDMETASRDYDAELPLGAGLLDRYYAASVTVVMGDMSHSLKTVLLFWRNGVWNGSSDEVIWEEPFVVTPGVLGIYVNFVAYLRRES